MFDNLAHSAPDEHPANDTLAPSPIKRFDGRALLARLDALDLPFGLTGRRVVLALVAALTVVVTLALTQMAHFTRLTAQEPVIDVDEHLSLVLDGEKPARVRVRITPFGDEANRQWQAAREALPSYLEPAGPIYHMTIRGSGKVRLILSEMPSDASLDLYAWDGRGGEWVFVPMRLDDTGWLWVEPIDGPVALFKNLAPVPLIGTILESGQTLNGAYAIVINTLLVAGVEGQADGTLNTSRLTTDNLPPGSYAVLPVIRIPDQTTLDLLLETDGARRAHIQGIVELVGEHDFAGVALDYDTVDSDHADAFHALVSDLSNALREKGKLLAVRLPTPTPTETGWDTGAYDWHRLGEMADILIVTPPGSPGDYAPGGLVDEFLTWAGSVVDRVKLHAAFPSLSVDEWAGQSTPISYEYAVSPLGDVGVSAETLNLMTNPKPGETLTFDLAGVTLMRSELGGLYHYEIPAGDGVHHVWLMTAAALRDRLDWVARYHVGGVLLEGLLGEGNSAGTLTAITEFKVRLPSTLSPELSVHWKVRDASGNLLTEEITDLEGRIAWAPEREGEYIVSADLVGDSISRRGAVAVIVGGETVGVVPDQEGVVVGAPTVPADSPTPAPPGEGMPPPVWPAGAVGNFELGGQVNHVVARPDLMKHAGMEWVKFQLAWATDMDSSIAWELISQGREHGFKVLLSIPGQVKYPTSIDIDGYLEFLHGVAYYGPDAVEVWNEENLDFEWPRGQIDGGRYTREMLAPAYNAIKSVNPNIMVISGAPASTGAYYEDGGCSLQGYGCDDWLYLQQMAEAGAANYMDCVGTHYNSGATSPSATTGHPADPGYQHYSWYFGSMLQLYGGTFGHPVCFTELGYLSGEGYGEVPERFYWARDITVAQQAAWLAEAAQLSLQNGNVRLMIVWNVDFAYWGEDPMAGYAIVRPDGTCPACDALNAVMMP